jgi:hypothetical protein
LLCPRTQPRRQSELLTKYALFYINKLLFQQAILHQFARKRKASSEDSENDEDEHDFSVIDELDDAEDEEAREAEDADREASDMAFLEDLDAELDDNEIVLTREETNLGRFSIHKVRVLYGCPSFSNR